MNEISLSFTTHLPQIDELIRGSIGLLELLFPNRIRAYYLVGSYVDGGYISTSDIDLVPMFKDVMQEGEEQAYRQAVAYMNQLSPIHLGFGLRYEEQSFRDGGIGIKIGSELLYGEDVRDQIPLLPLELYRQSLVTTSIGRMREERGSPEQLIFPLNYPDAQDEYYGYLTDEDDAQGTIHQSSAATFGHVMFLASSIVTLKTGQYNASKSFSWKFYQDHINDGWGAYLEEWYHRGKKQWEYTVPPTARERRRLKQLCQKALAFENEFLLLARDFILERSNCTDEQQRSWAEQELQKVFFDGA